MARWEKEETELKVPSSPLCANNCGLPGNPATKNMCQSCFTSHIDLAAPSLPSFKPRSEAAAAVRAEEEAAVARRPDEDGMIVRAGEDREVPAVVVVTAAGEKRSSSVNRCGGCGRKVGLTGFRCRCGGLFCAEHRYSDRHGCGFDYKAAARERIARENPAYKAAKIVRI